MNYKYTGIEVNQGLLRELAKKFQMVCGFVPPLPIKDESVHVVIADQVVEHMPTFQQAYDFLSDCRAVLKPSGLLILGFPDYARMTDLAFFDRDYSHSFLTTENRMDQILRDVRFKPVKIVRFTGSFHNPFLRLVVDFIMLCLYAKSTHLLMDSLRAGDFLYKFRKTFGATTVIFAKKCTNGGEG